MYWPLVRFRAALFYSSDSTPTSLPQSLQFVSLLHSIAILVYAFIVLVRFWVCAKCFCVDLRIYSTCAFFCLSSGCWWRTTPRARKYLWGIALYKSCCYYYCYCYYYYYFILFAGTEKEKDTKEDAVSLFSWVNILSCSTVLIIFVAVREIVSSSLIHCTGKVLERRCYCYESAERNQG